ncbi:MAG: HAD-IIB family hydrolase [Dehalococcoidia bacterium]|nr:HAD-IIB family hydrolase [Dehalococcoidia bacterium]
MPEYKALILDLDGTLIGPDELISPRVADAVREVAAKIGVSIATGRETGDVLKYGRELGLTWPQISDNGAQIIDPTSGDSLWSAPLGEALSRRAMQPIIESGSEFFATHAGGTITDLAKLDTWELTRVSALDLDEADADAMLESMADESGLDMVKVWLPYNRLWAVDFTRSGINKGSALHVLCEMSDITPSHTIAVGDSFNDLPLMETAGLGIAMGNAPSEVRNAAKHVVPSVEEDGLAHAIERHILPLL